jgi:hypothetical protein
VVALEVDSAVGGGVLLETGKTGVSCDVNSSTDTSVPDEEFTDGTDIDDGNGGFDEEDESPLPDPVPDNPDDGLDNQEEDPFEDYPKPSDPQYPPDPPEGIEPIPMGDGNLAPGPVPDTWVPGTWSSTFTIPAHTRIQYGDVDPGPSVECGVLATYSIPLSGPTAIPGPCWGLYVVDTPGTCGGSASRTWYTAVIGNGFSYWYTVATFSGGSAFGATTVDLVIANVFTPL